MVTEVSPVGDFWQAEPEHQDYLERYPDGYTCHFARPAGSCRGARPDRLAPRDLDHFATDCDGVSGSAAMTKGSDLLVRALESEGVEYIFGIPGEENLDVLNSLRGSKIKLVHHPA